MRDWLIWLITWAKAVPEEAAVLTIAATFGVLAIVFAVAGYRAWREAVLLEAQSEGDWLAEGNVRL